MKDISHDHEDKMHSLVDKKQKTSIDKFNYNSNELEMQQDRNHIFIKSMVNSLNKEKMDEQ